MDYDALIVGAGAAGMESALTLGDMGFKVLLVEKQPSVGGKMILLSKVFPTLDCASCISTPKMAATGHHPNVDVLVYSQVDSIRRLEDGTFRVGVTRKATHTDLEACTGCQKCELACSVAVPDEFNAELVSRRAAHIAFPQAVPKKAVIQKEGRSPCIGECPASIKAHGYVSLIRDGRYEEAMELILDDQPFAASLGRACYAPCEKKCSRSLLEGAVPIRRLKRFVADWYYARHPEPKPMTMMEPSGKRVAVVGAGPSGLTAAYHLARKGHRVVVFEESSEPGGMLRWALPSYRLPKVVLERDIKNVTALGVEIRTGRRVDDIDELRDEGFDAVYLALGCPVSRRMGIEGEELEGVVSALDFLRRVRTAEADSKDGRERDVGLDLSGKRVLVVGGGDVAVDCARVARRLGGEEVVVHYRRSAQEMPAQPEEIEGAKRESVAFELLRAPIRFFARDGGAAGARPLGCVSVDMELGEVDSSGRRRPIPIEGSERESEWDVVIMAIGLAPDPRGFRSVERRRDGTFRTGSVSGLSSAEGVFVGGDAASGPSSMTRAMGEGKRLSGEIDRYLRGEKAAEGREAEDPSPLVVDPEVVLVRQQTHRAMEARAAGEIDPKKRLSGFSEVELPMSEDDARYGASRCLDCGVCSECGQCVSVCPAECIELAQSDRKMDLEVGSVVLSTGYRLVDGRKLSNYGHGVYPNVITGMQMDRLLAPTRPYHSLVRPSDGKVPDNVGFVFCAGSRDRSADNRLCSRVCCMYSLKQAELIMGALPLADVTMYYIDIRAFGKGHEEFFREAEAMGAEMVKAKVGQIFETENNDLELTYEDIEGGGGAVSATHDLVVLSVGLVPNTDPLSLFRGGELEADEFHYVREVDEIVSPGRTSVEGVFVAGAASAAMDIPDTIAHANGAAVQAAAYLRRKAAVR